MTDFRALCVELTDCLEKSDWPHQYKSVFEQWIYIAHAALAESEPEEPTREESVAVYSEVMATHECQTLGDMAEHFARAVLARWGNHPGSPDSSTLQPVPVSERLPGPEDCNDKGEIWAWRRFDLERGIDNGDFWCLAFHDRLEYEDCGYTHWLPAHALPLPTHE